MSITRPMLVTLRQCVASVLILAIPATSLPISALAHGNGHGGSDPLHELPRAEAYADHLEQRLANAIQLNSRASSAEQEALGRELLAAAHAEIREYLEQNPNTLSRRAKTHARELLHLLNPVALGRWLIETAIRKGPILAVALGLAELSEQVGVYLAVKNPEFAFLVPIYFFHLGEVAVLTAAFGGPHFLRMVRKFQVHGGIVSGPERYYQHLLQQRQAFPIDWDEVIHLDRLPSSARGEEMSPAIDLVVISEGVLERRLPKRLRILTNPKHLAQRESMPTIALWELEELLAKQALLPPKHYRQFKKSSPELYASLLLNEAFQRPQIVEIIRERLAQYTPIDSNSAAHARENIDVDQLFREAKGPDDLKAADETPDLVAQRVLWHLHAQIDNLEHELREKGTPSRAQLSALRKAEKALRNPHGLERFAATSFPEAKPEDWQALYETIENVRDAFLALEDAVSIRVVEKASDSGQMAPIGCEGVFL
jgi:hypothetical protein